VNRKTAQISYPAHLKVVESRAALGELIRRARLERDWTQGQLAEYWGIRTQTVSAWERGQAPQRRFFAKIGGFIGVADERAVEMLLAGNDADTEDLPARKHDAPPHVADLQLRVVDAITRQLETGRRPTPELTKLFMELMVWAKQPASEMSAAEYAHLPAAAEDGDAESERPSLRDGGTARRRD
jgi:transcriptional regulator with XRE-family HTH domain